MADNIVAVEPELIDNSKDVVCSGDTNIVPTATQIVDVNETDSEQAEADDDEPEPYDEEADWARDDEHIAEWKAKLDAKQAELDKERFELRGYRSYINMCRADTKRRQTGLSQTE